jgi:hypothetical protein
LRSAAITLTAPSWARRATGRVTEGDRAAVQVHLLIHLVEQAEIP